MGREDEKILPRLYWLTGQLFQKQFRAVSKSLDSRFRGNDGGEYCHCERKVLIWAKQSRLPRRLKSPRNDGRGRMVLTFIPLPRLWLEQKLG